MIVRLDWHGDPAVDLRRRLRTAVDDGADDVDQHARAGRIDALGAVADRQVRRWPRTAITC